MLPKIVAWGLMSLGVLLLLLYLSLLPAVPTFWTSGVIPTPFILIGWFSIYPACFFCGSDFLVHLGLVGHLDPPMLSLRGITVLYFIPGVLLAISGFVIRMRSRLHRA